VPSGTTLWRAGRHGSIIHPQLGPLFRMGSVATSIPLETDKPVDAGIAAFCDTCRACRIYCPANAIPDHRSRDAGKDSIGKDRYIVDTGKCFPISPGTTRVPFVYRCVFTTTKSGRVTSRGFRRNCSPKSSCTTRRLPRTFPKRNGIATTSWDVNDFP
jgi:ferredoxin